MPPFRQATPSPPPPPVPTLIAPAPAMSSTSGNSTSDKANEDAGFEIPPNFVPPPPPREVGKLVIMNILTPCRSLNANIMHSLQKQNAHSSNCIVQFLSISLNTALCC